MLREKIRQEVESIDPFDDLERDTQKDVLAWIDSEVELCRIEKPATPDKHLVSYFVLVDGEHLLLVDHKMAQLWLPTGGHVEPNEHPRQTVLREAGEELSIQAEFLFEGPLFITSTVTVGRTAGHTDISLWYVLKGGRNLDINSDRSEFQSICWFKKDRVPLDRTDPHIDRFISKLYKTYDI
ncbi:MAG: NUDIX hydrolase [Verrucomicrobiota bacterium]